MSKVKKTNIILKEFETKGTGFKTTISALEKEGYPPANWKSNEKNDTFTIIFPYLVDQVTPQVTPQVTDQAEMRDRVAKIVKFCGKPRPLKEMMELLDLKDRKNFICQILDPLLKNKYLKRTKNRKNRDRHPISRDMEKYYV